MATEVKLPDGLEGVEDVTISRWLVQAGQQVKKGDPILEVATEKVDTQIEAPSDGTVLQINFNEGEIVAKDAVLVLIGMPGETEIHVPARSSHEPVSPGVAQALASPGAGDASGQVSPVELKATPVARRVAQEEGVSLDVIKGTGTGGQVTKDDVLSYVVQRKEPVGHPAPVTAIDERMADLASLPVKRLAAEHNINLRDVAQGRALGSLTVSDVLGDMASRVAGRPVVVEPRPRPSWAEPAAPMSPAPVRGIETRREEAATAPVPQSAGLTPGKAAVGQGEELIPHSRMRSLVARNTVQAAFTIPHVTTWWDVTVTAVVEHRKAHKSEYAAAGVNLTFTAYFIQAAIAGLRVVPAANSSWSDEGVILKHYLNVGVAVALPADRTGLGGLIVPVIKNAGDLSLMGVARAVNDLSQRAREGKLHTEDLQEGTFTITNYGTSGSRFQTPIIAGHEAGILGVGAMEKRPVVVSHGNPLEANTGDYLAFLPMVTLGFSYDHRILDGATADAFCAAVKDALENWK